MMGWTWWSSTGHDGHNNSDGLTVVLLRRCDEAIVIPRDSDYIMKLNNAVATHSCQYTKTMVTKVNSTFFCFLLMMFEAFGFSGELPTLQKIISATFERGHFGGRAALSEFSVFFLLGHLTSIADYFFPQVST